MIHPKIFILVVIFSVLASVIGCGSSDSNKAMDDFKKDKPLNQEGGFSLTNGDFAKYTIAADSQTAGAQIEISSQGQCYRVMGTIPIALIEGNDADGQFWQATDLKVQINPKQNDGLNYNRRFIHFAVDRKDTNKVACSDAPKEVVSDNELQAKMQKTFFSDLPLNDKQKQMAGPLLTRGSSTFMLYFKNHKLGLVFDSVSNELIGLDIPKQILESDFLFTSGRPQLEIANVPEDDLFPLIMSGDDMAIHRRSVDMANQIRGAVERLKDKSPADRDFIISNTWAQFFKK